MPHHSPPQFAELVVKLSYYSGTNDSRKGVSENQNQKIANLTSVACLGLALMMHDLGKEKAWHITSLHRSRDFTSETLQEEMKAGDKVCQ